MNIQVFYENGRVDEFDTENFTLPQPYPGDNMLTNFEVRFDMLATESLWLHAHYYDTRPDYAAETPAGEVPVARRKMGWRFLLVDKSEIDSVARITVNNEDAGWRQGGSFVNGIRFAQAAHTSCPIKDSAHLNARAVALHDYLARANPDIASDEEAICALFGFTAAAYAQVLDEELMQATPADGQQPEEDNPESNNDEEGSWLEKLKEERGL